MKTHKRTHQAEEMRFRELPFKQLRSSDQSIPVVDLGQMAEVEWAKQPDYDLEDINLNNSESDMEDIPLHVMEDIPLYDMEDIPLHDMEDIPLDWNSVFPIEKPNMIDLTDEDMTNVGNVQREAAILTPRRQYQPQMSQGNDMTPHGEDIWAKHLSTSDNYNILDLGSSDDTDDDENPRKTIPTWARMRTSAFQSAILRQYKSRQQ